MGLNGIEVSTFLNLVNTAKHFRKASRAWQNVP